VRITPLIGPPENLIKTMLCELWERFSNPFISTARRQARQREMEESIFREAESMRNLPPEKLSNPVWRAYRDQTLAVEKMIIVGRGILEKQKSGPQVPKAKSDERVYRLRPHHPLIFRLDTGATQSLRQHFSRSTENTRKRIDMRLPSDFTILRIVRSERPISY
jgi:hypothetical protein